MLIYGIKRVQIGNAKPSYPKCNHCGQQGTMELNFTSNHFHVFWIPLFPYRRKFTATCTNCLKKTKKKDFSEPLLREYFNLKNNIKTPLWQFSGLAFILFLVTFSFFQSGKHDKRQLDYRENPQVGDIYKLELDNGNYSTFKIKAISNDSLLVIPNAKEISKVMKVYKIDKEVNYYMEAYQISKDKINQMFESKEIYGITRD